MAELAHGKIGSVTVEVKPTVTLESAVACVMMLNMFLEDNEEYDLRCVDRGDGWKWELTDEVRPKLKTELTPAEREDRARALANGKLP